MKAGETQFWRVDNTTADEILDLQVLYDGVPQTMKIVGADGVPVNSQDGTQPGQLINSTDYRLATAGRVEFLVTAPAPTVKVAQFITNNVNTGPQGDCDPTRPIANIVLIGNTDPQTADEFVGTFTALNTNQQMFGGTGGLQLTATRVFQFSEIQPTEFFITQVSAGQTPTLFNNNNPPSVVTTQGSLEQWTIQNISQENHEFHLHQIHFKVLAQNNYEINGNPQNTALNNQFVDTIDVPFWDNVKNKKQSSAPAAVLLMDFRGMDIGQFVYHCHILSHEDLGMMAIIQVNPSP
jgi:FtsP/CotA-like multicopper oxidase with cupredoxin domain